MNENERRENLITEIVKLLRELPVAVVRELYAVALEHKKEQCRTESEIMLKQKRIMLKPGAAENAAPGFFTFRPLRPPL